MAKEIEVKILEINVKEVVKKLKALGAKKTFEGKIIAHYLDTKNDDLWKQKTVLRVRQRGDITELTLKTKSKGVREDIKQRNEFEVQVSDFEATKALFAELGFIERSFKEDKHRITYALGDTHFEIETSVGIPTYLEIEAPTFEKLEEAVTSLGYTMKNTVPWSTGEVRIHYGDRSIKK